MIDLINVKLVLRAPLLNVYYIKMYDGFELYVTGPYIINWTINQLGTCKVS